MIDTIMRFFTDEDNVKNSTQNSQFSNSSMRDQSRPSSYSLSERERARIISKAKNNLYFTKNSRRYMGTSIGMEHEYDSLGNLD